MKVSMKPLTALIAVLITIVLAVVVVTLWPEKGTGRADSENADQVAIGAAIYRDHCASCHGETLEGQPNWRERKPDGRLPAPPHDKSGHTWHHPDKHLFRITKIGVKPPLAPQGYQSDMPAFEAVLQDEEIWAVLSFIKKSWPPRERDRQNRMNEATPK